MFKEAMENYNQSVNFNDENAEAYLYRGALKVALNQMQAACNDFTRANVLGSVEAKEALTKNCR